MALRVIIENGVSEEIERLTAGNQDRLFDILSDLDDLGLEPEPDRDGWRMTSVRVASLCRAGYEIRRLTLKTNLPGHRFFYHHDAEHGCVYVMVVVVRNDSTYDKPNERHIQMVKRLYNEYYRRQLWLR